MYEPIRRSKWSLHPPPQSRTIFTGAVFNGVCIDKVVISMVCNMLCKNIKVNPFHAKQKTVYEVHLINSYGLWTSSAG